MDEDEATRAFRERGIQRNQVAVQNAANLQRDIAELRRTAPDRLRAAGYPSTNKTAAMCVWNGRQQAAWVILLNGSRREWVGVLPDGQIMAITGEPGDQNSGTLRIVGPYELTTAPVMILAAIKSLLETCTQTKRYSWE